MKINQMKLFVFIGLVGALSACSKQTSQSTAATSAAPAPSEDKQNPGSPDPVKDQDESAVCEKNLKEKMIKGEFRLSKKKGLDKYVDHANQSVLSLNEKTFLLKQDDFVREFGVSFCKNESDVLSCFVSTLSKTNQKKNEYVLKLQYSSSSVDKFVGLEENLLVKNNCEPISTESTLTLIDTLGNSEKETKRNDKSEDVSASSKMEKFKFQQFVATESSFSKIEDTIESKKKSIPLLFVDKFEDLRLAPENYSMYDNRTLGLLDYNLGSETTEKLYTHMKKIPYSDEKFDIRKFRVSFSDKTISIGYHAVNKKKTKFIKYNDGEFQVESKEDIISSVKLSSVEDLYKIHVKTEVQSESDNLAAIIFRKRVDSFYPDLPNYWDYFSVDYDKNGTILYLTNKYSETVYGGVLPADLASTTLIRVDHAEIQKVKQDLLNSELVQQDMKKRFSNKPNNKLLLVLIQKYISENFVEEKMSFEQMPGFRSVDQVLKRKRGNSQDLSLVFTAIARSLGIPCHLAVGYELTEPYATPSVWVEAQVNEVSPLDGYWMGIDYKSDGGTMLKNIKNVIPVSKGLLIEQEKRTLKQTLDTYKSSGQVTLLKPQKS
jgi:transglutaminase-like putative cysteine protease